HSRRIRCRQAQCMVCAGCGARCAERHPESLLVTPYLLGEYLQPKPSSSAPPLPVKHFRNYSASDNVVAGQLTSLRSLLETLITRKRPIRRIPFVFSSFTQFNRQNRATRKKMCNLAGL